MHLLFVDESGTPAKPNVRQPDFFVIAGLVIPERKWHDLRRKIIGLKRRRRYHGELKWRFFAPTNYNDDNPMKEWTPEDRNEMREEVFNIISDSRSCRVIASVSEARALYRRASVHTQNDLYFETYKPLTERFQYFLQDISKEAGRDVLGMIIADHRGKGDDDSMRRRHERLVHNDEMFTSRYENLIEGLFFTPSHLSIGVQLVDIVAGAIWRAFAKDDLRYFERIRPIVRTNSHGKLIDGFGIARTPKSDWDGPIIK